MADPTDYTQLPTGYWIKDADGTGPYVRTAWDTFALAGTAAGGSAGGGLTDAELRASPLSVTAAAGTLTDRSGSITTGGTAQVLAASNSARRGITLQNTSTGDLRVNPWGTASSTEGYEVAAGALLVLDAPHCGVGAISIWGATTAQTFVGGEAV